ncbi:hypothetical protein JOB18_012876 [Solea senegalensis]|uniref:Uncharacterized protein n=1 Tax=Solea senegalensis TaxID=28829 RepID=A0AAV6Q0Z7_SOLSE|nr:hypothetical protein JOB18_012876 [Solea senegalensis]
MPIAFELQPLFGFCTESQAAQVDSAAAAAVAAAVVVVLVQCKSAKESCSLHYTASLLLLLLPPHLLTSPPRETLLSAEGQREAQLPVNNVNVTQVHHESIIYQLKK